MLRRLVRSDAAQLFACWVISLYIRFVYATGRWRVERGDIPRRLHERGQAFILAFWHGRLLMMPMCWDRGVKIHMLISAHRDGRLIADAVKHFGIGSIAGSSSKGGTAALRQMIRALRAGECVGITPDGPRGPAMKAGEGIAVAARTAKAPIVPVSFATRGRRMLRTWDRFHLAYPFSAGVFVWGEPIAPAEAGERLRAIVEERLTALDAEADRLMGHAPAALAMAELRA